MKWLLPLIVLSALIPCFCPGSDDLIPRLNRLDPLKNELMRSIAPGSKDTQFEFGTILSRDCLELFEPGAEREAAKAYFHDALVYALSQSGQCYGATGLGSAREAIKHLRRARISCVRAKEEEFCADGEPFESCAAKREKYWGARNRLDLSVGTNTEIEIFEPRLRQTMASRKGLASRDNIPRFAMTLFHEALHSSPANTRNWHNSMQKLNVEKEVRLRTRGMQALLGGGPQDPETECTRTNYRDRITYLSAACFPEAVGDEWLLDPVTHEQPCAGLCEIAMSEVDADVSPPNLLGAKTSFASAHRVCKLILNATAHAQMLQAKLAKAQEAWRYNKYRLLPSHDNPKTAADISSITKQVDAMSLRASPSSLKQNFDKAELLGWYDDSLARLSSKIKDSCEKHAPPRKWGAGPEWKTFCSVNTRQIQEITDTYRSLIAELDESPYSLDRFSLAHEL